MNRRALRPIPFVVVLLVGLAGAPSVVRAQAPPEAIEYYATDALGSVRVVFDANGLVLGRSAYLPFGETLNQSGALPKQRFTGQERDGEAGLDYFNARSLQARTGRMNQPDPLFGGALAIPQAWNRYAYVQNNPLRMTDPTGMTAWEDNDNSLNEFLAATGQWRSWYDPSGGGSSIGPWGGTDPFQMSNEAAAFFAGAMAAEKQRRAEQANSSAQSTSSAQTISANVTTSYSVDPINTFTAMVFKEGSTCGRSCLSSGGKV